MNLSQTLQRVDRFVFGGGPDTPARLRTEEPSYWEAQGDRFQSLNEVADAFSQGRFGSEGVRVREKAWQPEKADENRVWGKRALLAGAALIGLGVATAVAAPVVGLGLAMAGMATGAAGLGFAEVAHDFDREPQIRELGYLAAGPQGAVYTSLDTDQTRTFPHSFSPEG